jgi:hypothetical protein
MEQSTSWEDNTFVMLIITSPSLMEPTGSQPYSQEPSTRLCREIGESSTHASTLFALHTF